MLREILYLNTNMPILKHGLDAQAARHRAIASNIANVESPGYVPLRVEFEEQLKLALGEHGERLTSTDPKHMPLKRDPRMVRHQVVEAPSAERSSGKNAVNIDLEMAKLATNQIHYRTTARAARELFSKMRSIAKGVR
ncbi:MAG TPA: flagellar basal body rod protein FlgB [Bacteroidetes bacterium]|nr:flagellar basal body rod protein FlgB [Bacteroidota bacterium]